MGTQIALAKQRLSKATSVQHWNMIRDELKTKVDMSTINHIDIWGFIKEVSINWTKN